MSLINQHKWITWLGIVLFLAGQTLSIAHASEFGPGPHEHNGVACFAILNDEQDGIDAAANAAAPTFIALVSTTVQPTKQALPKRLLSLRPPPTGPPSILSHLSYLHR